MKKLKLTINTEVGEVLTREELKHVYGGLEGSTESLKKCSCTLKLSDGKQISVPVENNSDKTCFQVCETQCENMQNDPAVNPCVEVKHSI